MTQQEGRDLPCDMCGQHWQEGGGAVSFSVHNPPGTFLMVRLCRVCALQTEIALQTSRTLRARVKERVIE